MSVIHKNSFANIKKTLWSNRVLYLMILPAIIGYGLFCYKPMYGILLAFKDYYSKLGIIGSPWVGFDNFKDIFAMDEFWRAFKNTLEINVLRLLFCFPIPIILALMLNEVRIKWFKRSVQTLVYLPYFISWVVIGGIIRSLLAPEDGAINQLIISLGGNSLDFLTSTNLFRPLLLISAVWKDAGYGSIIYLAALASIPEELYEAARIDGAGRLKQTIHITLPCLLPTISIMLILQIGAMLNGGFDQIFNLYNPVVYQVADVIDTFIFRIGINQGRYSIATAVGLFLTVINFILLIFANKFSKKISGQGLY